MTDQVAGLWQRHPQAKKWLPEAERLVASAKTMAEKNSFDQAEADLKAAEAEYRNPQQWSSNARQAMESINKTRAAIQKQLEQFPPDSARRLLSWPEALTATVEDRLLEGDGTAGLDEARRLAVQLPKVEKLLDVRRDVIAAARDARDCLQSDAFRDRCDAAGARLDEADAALARDRLSDAGRIYPEAAKQYRELLTELNEHIARLISRGKADLDAGQFTDAEKRFQAVLKIRPADATAAGLARQAKIGAGIAEVKDHDRSGERDQALTALAELRKLAPEDTTVQALVSEHVTALLARGNEELAAERFDTALQEYQRIFKLRPGDSSAQAAIKQADIRRRIAVVKDLTHSGDRSRSRCAGRRAQAFPEDNAVKALRDSIYDPRRAITNSIGMKLALIPAGEFLMGSPNDDKDAARPEPQHRVRITKAYYLGIHRGDARPVPAVRGPLRLSDRGREGRQGRLGLEREDARRSSNIHGTRGRTRVSSRPTSSPSST